MSNHAFELNHFVLLVVKVKIIFNITKFYAEQEEKKRIRFFMLSTFYNFIIFVYRIGFTFICCLADFKVEVFFLDISSVVFYVC